MVASECKIWVGNNEYGCENKQAKDPNKELRNYKIIIFNPLCPTREIRNRFTQRIGKDSTKDTVVFSLIFYRGV